MPRFAAGIEYDGRAYSGWQFQPGLQTVQDVVQRALSRVADAPVECVCAGRTDAGVHASAQVVHFDTDAVAQRAWLAPRHQLQSTRRCERRLAARSAGAFPRALQRHGAQLSLSHTQSRFALGAGFRARHLGAPAARCAAHALGRAGAGRRTRLQRVSRHRVPGEIPAAPRRAPRSHARCGLADASRSPPMRSCTTWFATSRGC